jgi:hypothetical protein
MNYIALVALILGLISIFITIRYIDNYDKLNLTIKKLSINSKYKYPKELTSIQDELNLSDNDFTKILKKHKKKIVNILKNEGFVDYKIYLNSYQRRLPNPQLLKLFKKELSNINFLKNNKKKTFSYEDVKKLTLNAIHKQDLENKNSENAVFDLSKLSTKKNAFKSSKAFCVEVYNGKPFRRYIDEKIQCKGKIKTIC